jgi:hypothetical protein
MVLAKTTFDLQAQTRTQAAKESMKRTWIIGVADVPQSLKWSSRYLAF